MNTQKATLQVLVLISVCFLHHVSAAGPARPNILFILADDQSYKAGVQDSWKLIHYLQPAVGDELYDTAADPEELHNRISVPDAAGRLADLQRALGAELDRTRAGFGGADR